MPWTMQDYPTSMKNLDIPVKKKAIDIANAMLDEGYSEDRAIPIAIEQAKEWRSNHSDKEINSYVKHGDPTKREAKKYPSNPERMKETEFVKPHDDGWQVISAGAKRASNVYKKKKADAIQRGEAIAKNKATELRIEDKDGKVQKQESFHD